MITSPGMIVYLELPYYYIKLPTRLQKSKAKRSKVVYNTVDKTVQTIVYESLKNMIRTCFLDPFA